MSERKQDNKDRHRFTLGTRILIGVLAGIATGVFLGAWSAPLQVLGDIYVGLLQMTVLPYVVVSLVSRIGGFTYERAAQVARHGTVVLLVLWGVALALVVLLPLSLPSWEAGTFFSASLIERGEGFDFLGLYIPTNPFGALADNIVPAVVLFSILVGIALIPLSHKGRLLDPLHVVGEALGNIAQGVVRLSPWGTFALAAGAAGTASPGELLRLGGYVGTFTIGVVLLTFVLFPALVASLSPIGYRELMGRSRGTLLTALATGKMFAVLPMIIDDVRALLASHGVEQEEARGAADVLVPLAYPFPNAGKILAILFIPFAAWFIGQPLNAGDYPVLLSVGLLSFFGSPVVAIPFLLGLFRMPADLLALFIVSGLWGARVGDVLGSMHLTTFSLLTASSERGWLRVRPGRTVGWLAGSVVAVVAALWLNHALVGWSIAGEPPPANRVSAMQSYFEGGTVADSEPAIPNPSPRAPGETVLERIQRTGELRVGYLESNPPFTYRNDDGALVGFEVDLAHRLAVELEAELRLVPYDIGSLDSAFVGDRFDLAIGGLGSFVREVEAYRESDPYLELHAALVVPDHRADDFGSIAQMRNMDEVRVAYVEGGVLVRTGRHRIPGIEIVAIPSDEQYLRGGTPEFDALLTTAETGAIHTMIYPEFSVVIPEGFRVRVPVILAVAADEALHRAVNRFIRIKRADGTIETLYEHWILGAPSARGERRWSVLRDVLGWGG
ncbi:MAG: cation:dicarboxylase symporter family transporter [Gemmatimonadota bacterium]|nr:MAG: cation:dicarboxylase symporter family transporter [Gemmatimonadota bacterium]